MTSARTLATIAARLQVDGTLDGLLARHPDAPAEPALISLSRRDEKKALAYPCVTITMVRDEPSSRFGPRPSSPGGEAIATIEAELMTWTMAADIAALEAINTRLDLQLHRQAFALATLPGSIDPQYAFFVERLVRFPERFDETRRAWKSMARYRFQIQL